MLPSSTFAFMDMKGEDESNKDMLYWVAAGKVTDEVRFIRELEFADIL